MHRADDRIAELVEEDPALNGTSTTATVALFDGTRFGVGHIGDSRAYLYRRGELRQLTHDHTFVQSPHRRGPDHRGAVADPPAPQPHPQGRSTASATRSPTSSSSPPRSGDRIFLCSDGACGTLTDDRMAEILGTGTPDFAAVELVRASLEAGSTDNVTCLVADVSEEAPPEDLARRCSSAPPPTCRAGCRCGGAVGGLFRGHRSGDTGEIPPGPGRRARGRLSPPTRSTPRPRATRPATPAATPGCAGCWWPPSLLGLAWVVLAAGWSWSQQQFYVAEDDGKVAIFRGIDASLPGVSLSHPYEVTDVELDPAQRHRRRARSARASRPTTWRTRG